MNNKFTLVWFTLVTESNCLLAYYIVRTVKTTTHIKLRAKIWDLRWRLKIVTVLLAVQLSWSQTCIVHIQCCCVVVRVIYTWKHTVIYVHCRCCRWRPMWRRHTEMAATTSRISFRTWVCFCARSCDNMASWLTRRWSCTRSSLRSANSPRSLHYPWLYSILTCLCWLTSWKELVAVEQFTSKFKFL